MPFGIVAADIVFRAIVQNVTQITLQNADVKPVDSFNFADFRRVDIELSDAFCFRCKLLRDRSNAIIEACAHGNNHVAVFYGIVCVGSAVHSEHFQ